MFAAELNSRAETLLAEMRARGLKLVTAESCTGGLIAALLTEIPGSSDVFERGFVTYSNEAKAEALGVDMALIEKHGAVSAQVARAMATGALVHSKADIAITVTGVAGPGGGSQEKPVGLVFFGIAERNSEARHVEKRFGDVGRQIIRLRSVETALGIVFDILGNERRA
jgi:nicotinamide-nucleotide amidase